MCVIHGIKKTTVVKGQDELDGLYLYIIYHKYYNLYYQ